MGYQAKEKITNLDYDFNPYAAVKGVTPEPSPDQIKTYWLAFQAMVRRNRNELVEWDQRLNQLDPDDRAGRNALDEEYAAWQDQASDERLVLRRKMLAAVCSDQPSVEDLEKLPGRVFDDFEGYMQEELTPKGSTNASN